MESLQTGTGVSFARRMTRRSPSTGRGTAQGIETADMTAQEIKEYQTGSWVFVRVGGRFVDAMEDFQLSVDNL